MAHMTLSIPDSIYFEIKKHPEIKWSEAAREGIKRQLAKLTGVVSGKELLNSLDSDTRKALDSISRLPVREWKKSYKRMKESEKRRLKSLTQAY